MKLFIAEKPSVARCIIDALGLSKKEQGYYVALNGDIVTWCFGHLLELASPDHYLGDNVPLNKSGKAKVWRMQDLPILPEAWTNQPKKDTKKQLVVISKLLKSCTTVVNCGDPDREGQLLIDEILEYYKCKKPVLRYISSAQDSASVKKALSSLKNNTNYSGMANAARARQRADWLIGMNLSRAYTLAAKGDLIAVGRVQTPTLNLVAQRDMEIKNFVSKDYYQISAQFAHNNGQFKANLDLSNLDGLDSEGRLVDKQKAAQYLQESSRFKDWVVSDVNQVQKELEHPKSLSLADIQQYASSKFGFSAKETLDICQSLYEVHKLTTYPRSDCSYLPESQHSEAPAILKSLAKVNPNLSDLILRANTDIKSNTWNDKKITAHHGIIPTSQVIDRNNLSGKEQKIYGYIVQRYLAQFFNKALISNTTVTIKSEQSNYIFTANGSNVIRAGFLMVAKELDETGKDNSQQLPNINKNDTLTLINAQLDSKKTKAPPYFTEGSLIKAMENIASVVDDPNYKKLLKEGDGIGTSATRASIIEELKRKGYLTVVKKHLQATDLAIKFLAHLPSIIKNPVLTAIYESKFKDIESGKISLYDFEHTQVKPFVIQEVNSAKTKKVI